MKSCFLFSPISVSVVYIHVPSDQNHITLARRFVESYQKFPPEHGHELVVVCNGSPPNEVTKGIFKPIPWVRFMYHDDSGWDIGAYQVVSNASASDLMVFLGGSTRLVKQGWLNRMVDAYVRHGEALYGAMGNRGNIGVNVYPHIRTTGFWLPRGLFNRYPLKVKENAQRYEFEHGKGCLTGWITGQGLKAWVVSWDGEYEWAKWDEVPNGFHRGDQSGLLVRDRLCDPPYY